MNSAPTLESQPDLPVAVILSTTNFISIPLASALRQHHLQIITATNFSELPPHFDYLFYLLDQNTSLSESDPLFSLSLPTSTKILICGSTTAHFPQLKLKALPNYRLVRLGFDQVYGEDMSLNHSSILSQFFSALNQAQPLIVLADGLNLIYPTYITDVISGLTKAMFSGHTHAQEFVLVNPAPITVLNLAYLLRQLAPGRQLINFDSSSPPPRFVFADSWLVGQTQLHWRPQVDLNQGIVKTLHWLSQVSSPPLSSTLTPPSSVIKFSRRFSVQLKLLLITLSLLLLLWPVLAAAATGLFGFILLKKNLFIQNQPSSYRHASQASTAFTTSRNYLNLFSQTVGRILPSKIFLRADKLVSGFVYLSQAQTDLILATQTAGELGSSILGQETSSPRELLSPTQLNLQSAKDKLNLAQAVFDPSRPNLDSLSWFGVGETLTQIRSHIKHWTSITSDSLLLIQLTEKLLFGPQQTYLILLQNNGELRPTGGFIEGLALLTVDSGQILDLEILNASTADGQLQGKVEPPLPIKTYLGQSNWYLRDSNWDPDFPASARQAEWFVRKELNRQVSGTFALNLFVLKSLLEAVGPVKLPDSNQTITAQNLLARAQSPQPTLTSQVLQAIYHQLPQLRQDQWFKLYAAIYQSLLSSQLLISPQAPDLNQLLTATRWNGEVTPASLPYQDFLVINEANLGANQVNFFITRNLHHKLRVFKEDYLLATTLVTYRNSSSAAWPGGAYKNYLRLLLPPGSQVEKVLIDQQQLPPNQLSLSSDSSFTAIGFLVTVAPQSQVTVEVTYRPPHQLVFLQGQATYSLFVPKQSGTDSDPLTINITLPPYIRLNQTTPQREPIPGAITFLTDLSTDRLFTLTLEK